MSAMSNFDDFTRKQLGNYSPEVPPDIWENIAAKRDKKKPIPFFWILFNRKTLVIAAILLGISSAGYFLLMDKQPLSNTSSSAILKDRNAGTKNDIVKDQSLNTKNSSNIDSGKASNKENNTETIKDDENAVATLPVEKESSSLSNKYLEAKNESKAANSFANTISTNKKKLQSTKKKFILLNKTNTNTESGDMIDNDEVVDNINQENNLGLLLSNPELITANSFSKSASIKISLDDLHLPPCPEVEKNAAGNKDYFEFYAGPDYAKKSYADTANSALLQKRKESTSFQSAFSAGFRYTRVFGNGASFRTGINYSQINEKFSYVQSNIVQLTYIIDPNTGDTTGTYLASGTRYKTTINRYHTFDIPLLLGFEVGNSRLHANFNAGVIMNIYSWQKGESLDTSYKPVNISTGKSPSLYQYKTNIGAGFMGGVSVYYKLTDQLHIMAEPYWRYNFSPMNKEMLSLQEKFTTMGIRLGIRFDLN